MGNTMQKFIVFTEAELKPIVDEATLEQTEEQWHEEFLAGVAALVIKTPVLYRSFGPFWWPLKKYIQDSGLIEGEPVDQTLVDQITMGGKTLDLAAAYAYHESTSKSLTSADTARIVKDKKGNSVEIQVIDDELEAIIAGG